MLYNGRGRVIELGRVFSSLGAAEEKELSPLSFVGNLMKVMWLELIERRVWIGMQ